MSMLKSINKVGKNKLESSYHCISASVIAFATVMELLTSMYLEPDILECEVKWALERITMNKPSGGDGIPVELFQILKDDAVKVLHSICQQIWKGKGEFSFQSQRKAKPKNAQSTTQLHSSHTLVK